MLERFKTNISKASLFSKEDKLLVAVSGGIDSMVLCGLLMDSKFNFAVAHCNFGLRKNESDGDEELVRDFCHRNGIDNYSKRFNTKEYMEGKGVSVQMAARELRYSWFKELMLENEFDYLLTGHHLNDNIETFFINLIRGAGINGLKGIEQKKNLVIRPLLAFTKEEIESYAQENNIVSRADSSNREDKYLRNYLRIHVIPKFKAINPGFENTFGNELNYLQASFEIVKDYVSTAKKEVLVVDGDLVKISIEKLKQQKQFSLLLFELLVEYGFNSSVIKNIEKSIDASGGKIFYSANHEILKDREFLIIRKKKEESRDCIFIDKKDVKVSSPIQLSFLYGKNLEIRNVGMNVAFIDADKLTFPLRLEKWESGDVFQPLGMKGFKKLSDFFINEKLTIFEKENQWLLKSGEEIIWIVGRRIDERYKISTTTQESLTIEFTP